MAISPTPLTPPTGGAAPTTTAAGGATTTTTTTVIPPATPGAGGGTPPAAVPGATATVTINNNRPWGWLRWILGILLIVALLGGGGWYYYDRQKDIDSKIEKVDEHAAEAWNKADTAGKSADLAHKKIDVTASLLKEQAENVDKAFGANNDEKIETPAKPEVNVSSSFADNIAATRKRLDSQKKKLQTIKFKKVEYAPNRRTIVKRVITQPGVDVTVKIDFDEMKAHREKLANRNIPLDAKSANLPQ